MSDKDPEKQKDEKKNTDLWKLKQEEKKRKKEAEAQGEALPPKADKKKDKNKEEKKKEKTSEEKSKEKSQQKKEEETQHLHKNDQKIGHPETKKQVVLPVYRKLTKIDDILTSKDKDSRSYQEELISKYMDQYLSQSDVFLYVSSKVKNHACQQVYVQGLNNCSEAELVCKYPDLSYFLEGSVTKIFIEAEYIFSNGSILAKQGALNVALMGKYYNIPVVAVGGSWTYNGWGPVNYQVLEERYGSEALKQYDWIEQKYLKSTISQIGVANPRQVSTYPLIIYKQTALQSVQW